MNLIETDSLEGDGIILLPKDGLYENVVFWFHGLGDTAHGWADAMEYLGVAKTKFILPTAPERPISLNRGMPMPGWSDIFGLHSDDPEDVEGFSGSVKRIETLVQKEIIENNIPSSRIIIGGFSQGGALALHYTLRHPTLSFGGCIAFSTWIPFHKDYPVAFSPHAASMAILQAHGTADAVVSYEWGHQSHLLLKSFISNPEPILLTIPRMGHSSHPNELGACKRFMDGVFGYETI